MFWILFILFDKCFDYYITIFYYIYNDNTTSWHDWALPLLVPLSTSARPSNRVSFFGDVQPCVWKLLLVAPAASKIDVTSHNDKATQSLLTIRKPMEPPCFWCTSITSQLYISRRSLRVHLRNLYKFMVSQGFWVTLTAQSKAAVKSIQSTWIKFALSLARIACQASPVLDAAEHVPREVPLPQSLSTPSLSSAVMRIPISGMSILPWVPNHYEDTDWQRFNM